MAKPTLAQKRRATERLWHTIRTFRDTPRISSPTTPRALQDAIAAGADVNDSDLREVPLTVLCRTTPRDPGTRSARDAMVRTLLDAGATPDLDAGNGHAIAVATRPPDVDPDLLMSLLIRGTSCEATLIERAAAALISLVRQGTFDPAVISTLDTIAGLPHWGPSMRLLLTNRDLLTAETLEQRLHPLSDQNGQHIAKILNLCAKHLGEPLTVTLVACADNYSDTQRLHDAAAALIEHMPETADQAMERAARLVPTGIAPWRIERLFDTLAPNTSTDGRANALTGLVQTTEQTRSTCTKRELGRPYPRCDTALHNARWELLEDLGIKLLDNLGTDELNTPNHNGDTMAHVLARTALGRRILAATGLPVDWRATNEAGYDPLGLGCAILCVENNSDAGNVAAIAWVKSALANGADQADLHALTGKLAQTTRHDIFDAIPAFSELLNRPRTRGQR